MLLGVPLVPMVVVGGAILLLSFWVSLLLLVLLVPALILMRLVVANDDQGFRLLGLKLKCRVLYPNRNARFWRASTYGPIEFKRRT